MRIGNEKEEKLLLAYFGSAQNIISWCQKNARRYDAYKENGAQCPSEMEYRLNGFHFELDYSDALGSVTQMVCSRIVNGKDYETLFCVRLHEVIERCQKEVTVSSKRDVGDFLNMVKQKDAKGGGVAAWRSE